MRMTVPALFWDAAELRQVYSLSKEVDPDALIEMDRAVIKSPSGRKACLCIVSHSSLHFRLLSVGSLNDSGLPVRTEYHRDRS
jgi:hypothetical protein